jgi:hypothetical protein
MKAINQGGGVMRKKIWYWLIPSYRRLHQDRELLLRQVDADQCNLGLYERLYQEMADMVVKQDKCIQFLHAEKERLEKRVAELEKYCGELGDEGVDIVDVQTSTDMDKAEQCLGDVVAVVSEVQQGIEQSKYEVHKGGTEG